MKLKKFTPFLLGAILLLSLFLRTYKLSENLHFTGDEGRDALIALDIANGNNLPILGPSMSVGSLSLGPLYYYLIAPFALIDANNPVFLAVPVIFFSVATSALLYFVTQALTKSRTAGLIAALFYAIAPWSVVYGRFSWNPNIMPFFSLLYFYSLWKALFQKRSKWFLLAALSFGVMVQSHYASLLVVPLTLIIFWRKRVFVVSNIKYVFIGLLVLAAMLSPLIYYDLSRNFRNLKGLIGIFSGTSGAGFEAHYFEMFWPFIFILFGYFVSIIVKAKRSVGLFLTLFLAFFALYSTTLAITGKQEPSVSGINQVIDLVEEESQGKRFNFAVLSDVNREDSYKYFFREKGLPVYFSTATEQLFVVCEGDINCSVHGHPKYEIAIFDVLYNGQVEIADEWRIENFYKVMKLVPKK